FPGNTEFLQLANFPLTSVTSVKVDPAQGFGSDTVIPATSYVVHLERGVIQSKVGPFVALQRSPALVNADRETWTRSPRAVEGLDPSASGTAPKDVEEAYGQSVGHWCGRGNRQSGWNLQSLARRKRGGGTVTYPLSKIPSSPGPPAVARLLVLY